MKFRFLKRKRYFEIKNVSGMSELRLSNRRYSLIITASWREELEQLVIYHNEKGEISSTAGYTHVNGERIEKVIVDKEYIKQWKKRITSMRKAMPWWKISNRVFLIKLRSCLTS